MNYCLIHGFLGQPEDWSQVLSFLKPHSSEQVWAPSLFQHSTLDARHGFQTWSEAFFQTLEQRFANHPVVLCGYSLGGRLALHAWARWPKRFTRVILLSTNPGILNDNELKERKIWQQQWHDKWTTLAWPQLLQEWNQQDVFQASHTPLRQESHFERSLLALAMTRWGLTEHTFTFADFMSIQPQPLWVFGAEDRKFLSVKSQIERHNGQNHIRSVAGAGHRLLWDAPQTVAEWIKGEP